MAADTPNRPPGKEGIRRRCGPAHQLTRGRLAVTGILRLLLLLNLEIVGNFFYATNGARYLFRAGSVLRRSNDSV
jgi:hypothetical protein